MRSAPPPSSPDSIGQGPLWCRTGTHRSLCFLKDREKQDNKFTSCSKGTIELICVLMAQSRLAHTYTVLDGQKYANQLQNFLHRTPHKLILGTISLLHNTQS